MGAGGSIRPRSHMVLGVGLQGGLWLADVGFGGMGLLKPLKLIPSAPVEQFGWTHRVVKEGGSLHVLQAQQGEGWIDQYAFTFEQQYPVDYEVSNHYTSTHPNSIFRKMLLVQRPGRECRLLLQNRKLVEQRPEGSSDTLLADDEAVRRVLAERFGLEFPEGTRFPFEES
jgi:N-hydroxyarylamine O-acetyltransferase